MTARLPRDLMTVIIALIVFLTVGVLHWPLVPVVLVAVPASIAIAFVHGKRRHHVA